VFVLFLSSESSALFTSGAGQFMELTPHTDDTRELAPCPPREMCCPMCGEKATRDTFAAEKDTGAEAFDGFSCSDCGWSENWKEGR
jgi:hypothetical protein